MKIKNFGRAFDKYNELSSSKYTTEKSPNGNYSTGKLPIVKCLSALISFFIKFQNKVGRFIYQIFINMKTPSPPNHRNNEMAQNTSVK